MVVRERWQPNIKFLLGINSRSVRSGTANAPRGDSNDRVVVSLNSYQWAPTVPLAGVLPGFCSTKHPAGNVRGGVEFVCCSAVRGGEDGDPSLLQEPRKFPRAELSRSPACHDGFLPSYQVILWQTDGHRRHGEVNRVFESYDGVVVVSVAGVVLGVGHPALHEETLLPVSRDVEIVVSNNNSRAHILYIIVWLPSIKQQYNDMYTIYCIVYLYTI